MRTLHTMKQNYLDLRWARWKSKLCGKILFPIGSQRTQCFEYFQIGRRVYLKQMSYNYMNYNHYKIKEKKVMKNIIVMGKVQIWIVSKTQSWATIVAKGSQDRSLQGEESHVGKYLQIPVWTCTYLQFSKTKMNIKSRQLVF